MANNDEKTLVISKELIFECLQKGSSEFELVKMVSERKLHGQGGSIKTLKKQYLTSKLFDKPVNIKDVTDDFHFPSDYNEYLYRHAYGTRTVYPPVLMVSALRQYDEYENLNAQKVKLIEGISEKFRTQIDQVYETITGIDGKVGNGEGVVLLCVLFERPIVR